ncbi:uncharacterized protein LOC136089028 isoform X2 [Hydra vulgaris]|uniref:Uncharacterized protein LOC136089028 isoform X2 n=1 Tax=Hydra vulgaris TaxID=6087 RepID=A0ABM4D8G2_HYDVU
MPCTLCNKFSVDDGCVICSQCLSSSSDIEDLDAFVTTGLNLFTKKSMIEIASSQLLKSIYSGQLYSYRHNWFIAGGEDKKNLCNRDLLSLLTEDQSHDLFNAFVLAFNSLKDSDYVFKVLVPESIVFLFAKASNVSRIKAEVALSTYISERDKKRFCSSPESTCGTDVDFSVSICSENQLLNKSLNDIGKSNSSISSKDLDTEPTITIDEPLGCSASKFLEDIDKSKSSISSEDFDTEPTIIIDEPLGCSASKKNKKDKEFSKNLQESCRKKVKCTEPGCNEMIIDLPRHLRSKKHGISKDKARKARGIHGLRKERSDKIDTSRSYQSYECPLCKIKTNRIHDHLYRSPHFLKNNPKKYHECLKNKILCEESLAIKLPVLTKKLPSYENKEQFVSVNVTSVNKGNILEFPSTDANNFAPKPNFTDFLEMFCLYLKSPSGGLKEGKAAINEMNQIRRMMEMLCPDPQQASYHLFFDLKKFQEVWFEHAKNKGYESGTKRSYLLSLTHFMDFILRSKLTPMLANVLPIDSFISAELICLCQKEISKWRSALKPEEADREYAIMIKDTEDVIPKDVFFQVQNSSFNNQIIEKTKQIHKTFIDKPEEYISNRTTFTNVRDSICFSLITNNISRSGAIANFKTDEYIRGSYSPTGSYIVMVKKHKTGQLWPMSINY